MPICEGCPFQSSLVVEEIEQDLKRETGDMRPTGSFVRVTSQMYMDVVASENHCDNEEIPDPQDCPFESIATAFAENTFQIARLEQSWDLDYKKED